MPMIYRHVVGPILPVPMLQYTDSSSIELEQLRYDLYMGRYPHGVSIDHSFSFWRVTVDYAEGTEYFIVEPGDVVVWQEKAVWHFKAADKTCTAYSRDKVRNTP